MKILHALAWYFPESSGGTEVYVEALVRELRAFGMESRILAAAADGAERSYAHAGTPVSRYPAPPPPDRVETVRGERPPPGFERFRAGLGQQRDVEIYHQHSWTTACGLHHLETARALGFKTVLTVHVPSNLCLRGTMLLFGDRPCDGRIEETRCAACWANGRGLPLVAAWALARLPLTLSERAARVRQPSRWATALAARALARDKQRQFARMTAAADRIVAVCDWLRAALRLNGVPESRLTRSRQGVSEAWPVTERPRRAPDAPFRLGFLGRWHPTKGIHVLLDALRRLPPELPLELVIHAMTGGEEDRRYRDALLAAHGPDRRLRVEPPVSRDRIPPTLAGFDVLAVPSQWLETGPLVVLEAQAAGVPVLGSDLGGIAERVTPGVNGWRVAPAGDGRAWADAIGRLVAGEWSLPPLAQRPPVRVMADAAADMAGLYAALRDHQAAG